MDQCHNIKFYDQEIILLKDINFVHKSKFIVLKIKFILG